MTSKAFGLAQLGNAYADGALSSRNKVINGAMTIDQHNAGAAVTPASGNYTLDRWQYAASQASKFTVEQTVSGVSGPVGFTNYAGLTTASAVSVASGDYFIFRQMLEGNNVADLGWGSADAQPVTLSFWVRSSLTGTFGGALNNSALDRSYPFTFAISASNTWEYKTVTIAGDTSGTWLTTNGIGIHLHFGLGVGSTLSGAAGSWSGSALFSATGAVSVVGTSGATFYLTGVQLEAGDTATPFEHRSYGQELALCQRYYVRYTGSSNGLMVSNSTGYSSSSNIFYRVGWSFQAEMRVAPTATFVGLSAWDGAVLAGSVATTGIYATTKKWEADYSCAASLNTGRPVQLYGANASTYAEFDAEL